jgi:hypothetical protein
VTRRVVALGRKQAAYSTRTWTYATGEPLWASEDPNTPAEVDQDLQRKIALESRDPEDIR